MVEPGFVAGTESLDAEVKEPEDGGDAESQQLEEVESVDALAGDVESEEVRGVDEEPPLSAGEIDSVENEGEPPLSAGEIDRVENEGNTEVENEDNAGVDVDGEVREQHEAGNDEGDIYEWIADVRKREVCTVATDVVGDCSFVIARLLRVFTHVRHINLVFLLEISLSEEVTFPNLK